MGRAAIPSRRYWKLKEEHEKVVRLLKDLEDKHLSKGKGEVRKAGFWEKVKEIVG